MALERSYESDTGFTAPAAYHRVVTVNADWHAQVAQVVVVIFKDATARNEDKKPVGRLKYVLGTRADDTGKTFEDVFGVDTLSAADNNPVREVYRWLKQKPEFREAVDV